MTDHTENGRAALNMSQSHAPLALCITALSMCVTVTYDMIKGIGHFTKMGHIQIFSTAAKVKNFGTLLG